MGSGSSVSANRATIYRKNSWPATARRAQKLSKVSVYNDWGKGDVKKRGLKLSGGTGAVIFVSALHKDKADAITRQFVAQAFPVKVVFVKRDRMSFRMFCEGEKVRLTPDTAVMVSVLNDVVYCAQTLEVSTVDQWSRQHVFPPPDKLVYCDYYVNGG